MEDLISVVIITYKRPISILKRAINSALDQDYENFEIIVVNDCPEDVEGTQEIEQLINSYRNDKLSLVNHDENRGANAARNTGIKMSKGKYIAFLDDDDEWISKKLRTQHDAIKKSDRYGIAYSGFTRVIKGEHIPNYPKSNNEEMDSIKRILEDNFVGPTSFSLVSRQAIEKVGTFDEKMKVCQEYDLWIRIL